MVTVLSERKTSRERRGKQMRGKQTLVINGKVYDAVSGLPVAAPDPIIKTAPVATRVAPVAEIITTAPITPRNPHHAKRAHSITKKSSTLRRDFLTKPVSTAQVHAARRTPLSGNVQRSDMIQKFAAHPQPLQPTAARPKGLAPRLDITPVKQKPASIIAQKHALVSMGTTSSPHPALSSRSVREQLIAERLASVNTAPSAPHKARGGFLSKQPRIARIATVSFAIFVLGGYFTYLNMPGLSVRVAASQADVAANYPDYHPDGYSFSGPVAFAQGQVAIDFHANGGNGKYTITQQKSGWDSQAVYDNVVAKVADDSYVTNSQQGLTIYTFKGDAAWVNKGILYTISGDAPLSNEQLLRIAGSL